MKKIWKIILGIVLGILVITGAVLAVVLPVTYRVDESLIVKNPDYSVYAERRDGYMTLVKKDASGNVLDADFKVIGFTDTHLDHNQEKGNITMEYIIRNIVNEKPDLVVFVGDNVTSSFNGRRVRQFCKVMEELGVYWTCVLGNHEGDNIWSISRKKMVKTFASYPHCLIEADTKKTSDGKTVWGNGNHVINLADSKGNITRSLFFFDGGNEMTEAELKEYADEIAAGSGRSDDYVKESQIQWYQETLAAIGDLGKSASGNAGTVPSAVFVHIPLPEYKTAYEELTGETEVSPLNVPVYNVPNENGDFMLAGRRREGICCSGHNSGLFGAILKNDSTDLIVCGHDHINDFVLNYQGVTLSYNVPSGYSSYNVYTKKLSNTLIKGYTRYTFRNDGSFGLEQMRNADLYPEAQDTIKKLYGEGGTGNTEQNSEEAAGTVPSDIELPEDFSFSIVWNINGISSYDSQTGKLVKTTDATDVSRYMAYVKLSEDALKEVFRYLFIDIDITEYPDAYDPFNAPDAAAIFMSEPNQTIILSAAANGKMKTVKCEKVALGSLTDCFSDEARAFMTSEEKIEKLLMELPEWEAFPDYEFYYE